MPAPTILIIDDERDLMEYCQCFVTKQHSYLHVTNGKEAVEQIKGGDVDLVLLDRSFHKLNPAELLGDPRDAENEGLVILQEIRKSCPNLPVIMITQHGDYRSAKEALLLGATDFIEWGALSEDRYFLYRRIERALTDNELAVELLVKEYNSLGLIGSSCAMVEIFRLVERIKDFPGCITIQGETGTGKDLIARAIHQMGRRSPGPFVKLNCANLPQELVESELFGYEKGAYTGASNEKPGRFEVADTGTIFLNEISEISCSVQTKLLRVVQEKTFERLGSNKPITVDVSIVVASNQDLELAVKERRFRQDLYQRLNMAKIFIPPLRERKSDMPALIYHFINKHSCSFDREISGVSKEALEYLCQLDFANGNVRELENLLIACMSSADGPIGLKDIVEWEQREKRAAIKSDERPRCDGFEDLARFGTLKELEDRIIRARWESMDRRAEDTWRSLGIGKTKFFEWLRQHREKEGFEG